METSRKTYRSWLPAVLLLALVLFAVLRSAAGTRLDSYTIDEPWHTVAGASYVRHGDFALNPEHPPLVKLWVGAWLPSSFVVPPTPVLREKDDERDFVEDTMYRDNDYLAAQANTRASMWAFHAVLLLALGALTWRAFGPAWALGTIGFLALEPSVGAYLPVVMTDLPVALALVLAAVALGVTLATWRWRWAAVLGLTLGLALSSKHSALAGLAGLAAFALLGWLWQARGASGRERLRRLAQLVAAGALAIALLWAQYGFRFHPHADGSDGFNRPMAQKLDDLRTPKMKQLIAFADTAQLLPRPYLWGLADTVRAGVEGRGDVGVQLWGRFIPGTPPWYTWPSLVVSKVPLALLAMALLGVLLLWRLPLPASARWALGAVLAMGVAYALSLASARSAYAGVRHAMPLVVVCALLAGGLVAYAWQRRRAWRVVALLPLALTLAMTWSEPRLWEYHNELAGGTQEAWRYFDNESMDLGQRYHEVVAFGQREVGAGQVVYFDYFNSQPQNRRAPFPVRRRVESVQDENVAGVYEGWFVKSARSRLPAPHFSYDPEEMLRGLEPVTRLGNVEIWRGRQEQPRARAASLYGRLVEYVYSDGGDDWSLVARRGQEIIDQFPQHAPAAIELGNAHLRLGDRTAARKAYADVLAQTLLPVEELTRKSLERQIGMLDSDQALAQIAPLRNAAME